MSTPAPFDLATLNAHLRQRIEVLCPAESDRQLLHQRLAHIAKDEPYTIRPSTRPLAELIDHTILKADARLVDVQQLCADALAHRFATVCVNGSRVPAAVEYLNAHAASSVSPPTVTAVIGFPLGSMDSRSKAFECQSVLLSGARDVDMVINVGLVKDGNFQAVREDIQAVYNEVVKANQEQAPDRPKKILKVILETSLLTELEIIDVTLLCAIVGVQFVKTSTGFSTGGAVASQVRLMKSIVGDFAEVKASGGIRDAVGARAMVDAGATRLGCSASIAIANGDAPATGKSDKY